MRPVTQRRQNSYFFHRKNDTRTNNISRYILVNLSRSRQKVSRPCSNKVESTATRSYANSLSVFHFVLRLPTFGLSGVKFESSATLCAAAPQLGRLKFPAHDLGETQTSTWRGPGSTSSLLEPPQSLKVQHFSYGQWFINSRERLSRIYVKALSPPPFCGSTVGFA